MKPATRMSEMQRRAEAYPRLVEALRALTVAHGAPNEMLTARTQAVKDGKRLLAELEE